MSYALKCHGCETPILETDDHGRARRRAWWGTVATRRRDVVGGAGTMRLPDGTEIHACEYPSVCSVRCAELVCETWPRHPEGEKILTAAFGSEGFFVDGPQGRDWVVTTAPPRKVYPSAPDAPPPDDAWLEVVLPRPVEPVEPF